MNEIDLLRCQLTVERARVAAVARACAATPGAGRDPSDLTAWHAACLEYLRCVLSWFEARDRRLAALPEGYALPQAQPAGGPPAPVLPNVPAAGRGGEWLERLESTLAGGAGWPAFAQFLEEDWCARRDALDAVRDSLQRVAAWRIVAGVDAESILTERRLYARVQALLPAGASLEPPVSREA